MFNKSPEWRLMVCAVRLMTRFFFSSSICWHWANKYFIPVSFHWLSFHHSRIIFLDRITDVEIIYSLHGYLKTQHDWNKNIKACLKISECHSICYTKQTEFNNIDTVTWLQSFTKKNTVKKWNFFRGGRRTCVLPHALCSTPVPAPLSSYRPSLFLWFHCTADVLTGSCHRKTRPH